MKKIDFRQRAAKTEERKRKSKYADVMVRATVMGLMKPDEDVDRMMDIESADKKFNMRLDEWLNADDFNFAHGGFRKVIIFTQTGLHMQRLTF